MKKPIRLIMTDLDGTLLREDKTVSEETKRVIRTVKQAGVLFGIATGRTLHAVEQLAVEWGIADLVDVLVGMNGAQYFDADGFRETTDLLEGKYMIELMERIQDPHIVFAVYGNEERKVYVNRWMQEIQAVADNNHFTLQVEDLKERFRNHSYEKLLLACPASYMDDLKEYCRDIVTEHYRGFCTGPTLYEFMNPIVSKSYGIEKVCRHHGFTMDEVMVLGDNSNDVEMIRDAGVGVCMKNGSDDAKAVAAYITEYSNMEDGWAKFVEAYCLGDSVTTKG